MPQDSKSQAAASEGNSERQQNDKQKKKTEFSDAELKRLRDSMRREASKIKKPERKLYEPYTFNSLDPYFDLSTAEFVHDLQVDVHHGYTSRHLATGLCEPQTALRMDVEIPAKNPSSPRRGQQSGQKQETKDDRERSPPEGSTRLPKFPAVQFSISKIPKKKEYDFTDVPTLRQAVDEQCSPRGNRKIDEDYKKTKADFYRMELDKMNEYSSINRPNMRAAYFAYLQNTIGSRKAVRDCVRSVDKDQQEKSDENGEQNEHQKSNPENGKDDQHQHHDDKERKTDKTGAKEEKNAGKTKDEKSDGKQKDQQATQKDKSSTKKQKDGDTKQRHDDDKKEKGDVKKTEKQEKKTGKTSTGNDVETKGNSKDSQVNNDKEKKKSDKVTSEKKKDDKKGEENKKDKDNDQHAREAADTEKKPTSSSKVGNKK